MNLIEACFGEGSRLLSVNTDDLFIQNPTRSFKNKDVKFSTNQIGRVKPITYFERNFREKIDLNDFVSKHGEGYIYTGAAGSGKTKGLINLLLNNEKPIMFSITIKAVQNVKKRLKIKMKRMKRKVRDVKCLTENVNKICHAFDSYFCEWNNNNAD